MNIAKATHINDHFVSADVSSAAALSCLASSSFDLKGLSLLPLRG